MTMDWERLLNARRLRRATNKSLACERNPFEIDQDRICFSQPFRRLQSKTQVHPLSENDHVRTRLTHSVEVASVGQALGSLVGEKLIEKHRLPFARDDFGSLVKAACLAHDIGNPPFGHAGEFAIREWFAQPRTEETAFASDMTSAQCEDLRCYEGNAEGFRILTQIENYRWNGGLQLTFATLATVTKYPWAVDAARNKNRKFGYFQAEAAYAEEVAQEVGLIAQAGGGWCRHPLAYLVEAADDICYSIVDL